jgi:hypothetical protein
MLTRWRTRRTDKQRREQEVADALDRVSVLALEATALREDLATARRLEAEARSAAEGMWLLAAGHGETIGAVRAVLDRWGHDRDGTVADLVAELRQVLDGQAGAVRRG